MPAIARGHDPIARTLPHMPANRIVPLMPAVAFICGVTVAAVDS
jgi:hypothetical protein